MTGVPFTTSRMLGTPLGSRLLGEEVTTDLYVRNPFRLLGLPACVSDSKLIEATQRFRNQFRLNPKLALKSSVLTGYEAQSSELDATACLARISNPKHRLLHELFWPHLETDFFAHIVAERQIASPKLLTLLDNSLAKSSGVDGARRRHAMVVVTHNAAIAADLAGTQSNGTRDQYWTKALAIWAEVVADDAFWAYLGERAKTFGDSRLHPDDVIDLRRQLPRTLLEINGLFSKSYYGSDALADCRRHFALIAQSSFPTEDKTQAQTTLVRSIANQRLQPLVNRIDADLMGRTERFNRAAFQKVATPILDAAFQIRDTLRTDLGLSDDVIAEAHFDVFCDKLSSAMDSSLSYSGDDRERTLLFDCLINRRMLGLPLSSSARIRIEKACASDARFLYEDLVESFPDPLRCQFAPGETADPDASVTVGMYKITERIVNTDSVKQTYGIRVMYRNRRVLVPRSKEAKSFFRGWKKLEVPVFAAAVVLGIAVLMSANEPLALSTILTKLPVQLMIAFIVGRAVRGISRSKRQNDFGPYKGALKQGFKIGKEPNEEEMKITPAETAEAYRRLRNRY